MADSRRLGLANQLDIEQILIEAQHRWLRPAEICEILQNYKKFRIAPEPANMPPNGSLFLFDRKVLRYFRKDGHNWRKKKDGKTVKEAHERLKAGSIDVLHCYYAHGEENENFQRRSYWMLEEDLSHIVLVHYREVKGNRTNYNRIKETEEADTAPSSEIDSPASSSIPPNSYQMLSQTTDTTSLNSAQASEYEDAESAYNQASSRLHPFLELQQPFAEKIDAGINDAYYPVSFSNNNQEKLSAIPGMDSSAGVSSDHPKNLDFPAWDNTLGNNAASIHLPFQPAFSATQSNNLTAIQKQEQEPFEQLFTNGFGKHPQIQEEWQTLLTGSDNNLTFRYQSEVASGDELLKVHRGNAEHDDFVKPVSKSNMNLEEKPYISGMKQPLLDGSFAEEGLKKLDSFNRWMSKELGDVNESHMQTTSRAYWDSVESDTCVDDSSQVRLDNYVLSPSLSQEQLFSIIDFSPNWAYESSEVKVLITGRFLKVDQAEMNKWSCMFGEVEVPAEIIAEGVLRCNAPIHKVGRVPFYVTCSNRLACSEVREFEYRLNEARDVQTKYNQSGCTNEILKLRFGKLMSLTSTSSNANPVNLAEMSQLSNKISSLLKEDQDEWDQMFRLTSEENFSVERVQEQLHQKLLKEKLHEWLLHKVAEGGKGPSLLDEGGQGVLHFAAALGYDWALEPTIVAGVSVNFRDANGWTALHWAAFCGRERTVASLISLGAAPGLLTDPSPKYPSGKTPADLASDNGHKGISGYLAESALSAHLKCLDLDAKAGKTTDTSILNAVQTVSERTATPIKDGDPDRLSLKDSLAAVCNATQAAARIHQVFRVQSFQRKQLEEFSDDKFGLSDEHALSLIAVKAQKSGRQNDDVNAAAIRIQNKFRGWKGRKDFLNMRQHVVKIQAHVRGHQVRKNYKKFVWSVGIVEKIILRWRRKGSGLRGFKSEPVVEVPSIQDQSSSKDDDYDFLKEGRKQSEQRMQKALARVKSMVQYPEARNQYRRLLNVVTEIQEKKVPYDDVMYTEGTVDFEDDLIDIEALLEDDTYMPTATQ
ncbi:calmodulin-binding transcription activator 3 isoform X2 [Humulus lupulus]|uniref:calmodulin-binding transcription activator 3 isoform X2 n=1 Tax=Humulus lupulus TaxID=3486 RepID=UPI002B409994|nr:calmodulin-binding transcription activator 3 isoform X2 [Humulus lupulus]